jgi:hypothetical protein
MRASEHLQAKAAALTPAALALLGLDNRQPFADGQPNSVTA